ncbi:MULTISPECIES: Na+/H+ antiporter subunit E [unclassified Saccharicrinis]|uniref:Na+/H+ antiporter subunit E n=1 Tax=unclassified Saccharicrinis TaxID=2646859 RepID=UPI003D33B76A
MRALKKIYLFISFLMFYLLKLIQANIYIAYDILTPKMHTNPGFVWVPIKVSSDIGILLLCNLVSMTPGTLSVDIDRDKKKLLVHYLYKTLDSDVVAEIEEMQDRIIELTT